MTNEKLQQQHPLFFVAAGEKSGDIHASHLMAEIRKQCPGAVFRGFGGQQMQAQGMECLADLPSHAVMGVFPVLASLPRIRRWFRDALEDLEKHRPDAIILVDYPGFNLRLAAKAKAMGIKVIYYISPQVWAWNRGRILKIAEIVDLMLVILPFEVEAYEGTGLDVRFVGHPLVDHLSEIELDHELIRELRNEAGSCAIGLLPGSRFHVFKSLWPVYRRVARLLVDRHGLPDPLFMVAAADDRIAAHIESNGGIGGLRYRVIRNKSQEVMKAADLCITASGTTTLEIASHGRPFVLCYRVSPIVYWLGRLLVRVPHIGLVNLIASRKIVPEHIGCRSFHAEVAADIADLWNNETRKDRMLMDLGEVMEKLETPGSYALTAQHVLGFIGH